MAHKIYSQHILYHCVLESLKVHVRNKGPKSARQFLIATQNTEYNRFHSFLISFLWTNFHISPSSNMPTQPTECAARRVRSPPSACARGGCVSPWEIIKAAYTVHVASWWICRQYLHMIYWCSGTIWSCVWAAKLMILICEFGHYCSGGEGSLSCEPKKDFHS